MKILQFLAVVLGMLALVPGLAHLFELPNKIYLDEADYFIVQNIYRGWSLFGTVLIANLLANAALAYALRAEHGALWLVLANLLCIVGSLAIFFVFTFPTNQATNQWTEVPANWKQLRWQWEMSHAATAAIGFIGFCSLTLSVLYTRE
jgi:uncharacterized membrane protein